MNRLPMILAWLAVGTWMGATVRVATSPDADLTPIALAVTAVLVVVAYKITQGYEKKRQGGR